MPDISKNISEVTYRALKEKEINQFGEYRTLRMSAWRRGMVNKDENENER